ncbi:MAG: carbohydrate binding family 9 domain-containing protein [Betaproteobacteria bacterium]|nr:carbohydrate binding family 9 domain-containing protein [Betaproteobacteria bacterium]
MIAQSGGGAPSGGSARVLTRDVDGRISVRATRITGSIRVDGRLDEAAYRQVPPITDFIQMEPAEGAPTTEKTEAWILFDDRNIYIACRCWDEHPERIVANDLRRDSGNQSQHDHFAVGFDTFYDGRNGFQFGVTAAGGLRDGTITDERLNADWNGVHDAKSSRFDRGWIAEIAVPFKTLRYTPGRQQTWHIQLRRLIRSKNEMTYITPVSPTWGIRGMSQFSLAATLVDLETPPVALNLEVKPYALSRVVTDLLRRPMVRNHLDPDAGVDVKYGLTKGLTADLTYNTDFAQVEADEAQVNLTRFGLSFPEKREFFLEGQGIFQFGSGGAGDVPSADVPTIFYSRRIGLSGARAVPVIAGGRVTGRAGLWSVGALTMETDDDVAAAAAQTNFTVLRLRRDILRRSMLGGIFTRRSVSMTAPGANTVWGLDAKFAFYQNVYFSGYAAQSKTEGQRETDGSYRTQFSYTADRYGLALDRLVVGEHFNPEVGFLRRENFRRNFAQTRFSPRPTNHRQVRKVTSQLSFDYITNNHNFLESRELQGLFAVDFHNGDGISAQYSRLLEFLPAPFLVSRGVSIPAGGYQFDNVLATYTAGAQRRVSGSSALEIGSFYDGDKTTATFRGRVEVTPQLGVEPNVSVNWIELPQGRFTTTIVGGRAFFTMTPQMFAAALVQYGSSNASLSTNLRFRWEYQPGSELFVVYSEGRSTFPPRGTELENRGLAVKINRLFRF